MQLVDGITPIANLCPLMEKSHGVKGDCKLCITWKSQIWELCISRIHQLERKELYRQIHGSVTT